MAAGTGIALIVSAEKAALMGVAFCFGNPDVGTIGFLSGNED